MEMSKSATFSLSVADRLISIENRLATTLSHLPMNMPVEYVYNPVDYASKPHEQFVRRYINGPKKVFFLGMNPGPWGMAQTGVPFGEVKNTKEFLGITEREVRQPKTEHPKRPVTGFDCTRSEVSGERFWGFFKEECQGDPERFFSDCGVYNHCPLMYMAASGKNVTPADMKAAHREEILQLCDSALAQVLKLLEVETVVGVGKYAADRAKRVISKDVELKGIQVSSILHPSPASPAANKGWSAVVKRQLEDLGLMELFQNG